MLPIENSILNLTILTHQIQIGVRKMGSFYWVQISLWGDEKVDMISVDGCTQWEQT